MPKFTVRSRLHLNGQPFEIGDPIELAEDAGLQEAFIFADLEARGVISQDEEGTDLKSETTPETAKSNVGQVADNAVPKPATVAKSTATEAKPARAPRATRKGAPRKSA